MQAVDAQDTKREKTLTTIIGENQAVAQEVNIWHKVNIKSSKLKQSIELI